MALQNKTGPTALILTRQKVPNLEREAGFNVTDVKKGGYIISKQNGDHPDLIIIASGSELHLAMNSKQILEGNGLSTRVISMPSLETFRKQPNEYKNEMISKKAKAVVIIEAGVTFGWKAITYLPTLVIGIDRFGASAPNKVLEDKFGFNEDDVVKRVQGFLSELPQ
jgi:transketolase